MICQKHKLTFWYKVFEEYSLLLTKFDTHSGKNDLVQNKNRLQVHDGRTNHRLFSSRSDNEICKRNLSNNISQFV